MLALTQAQGIILAVGGADLHRGRRGGPRPARPPARADRHPERDAAGTVRSRPRDAAPAQAPGMGRAPRPVLRDLDPGRLAARTRDQPRPGEAAHDGRDRAAATRSSCSPRRTRPASGASSATGPSSRARRSRTRQTEDPSDAIPTPDLTTVCGGPYTGHPLIYGMRDIQTTIEQGRGQMPSWSIRYEGALGDQQINDIVNYIVSIQDEEQVPFEQNLCTNPEAVTPPSRSSSTATPPTSPRRPTTSSSDARPVVPRVRDLLRDDPQGRAHRDHRVRPVRRQRPARARGGVRPADGLPRPRGRVLRLDDHPVVPVDVRLLLAGPRDPGEPRAEGRGARVGRRVRGQRPRGRLRGVRHVSGRRGWRPAGTNDNDEASVQSVTSATQGYLAAQANADAGSARTTRGDRDHGLHRRGHRVLRDRGRRLARRGAGVLHRRWAGPHGVPPPRLGERQPLLVDVPDRLERCSSRSISRSWTAPRRSARRS